MDNMSFEEKIKRLDEIVKIMENNTLELSRALEVFAEGASLLTLCNKEINEAEQTILKITRGEDGIPKEIEVSEESINE